ELRQGRFDEALAVLERGMAAAPKETRLAGFLGHVAQEWARATYRAEGPDQAKRLFTQLQARYPDRAAIRDGARGYFHVIVKSVCDEQKSEEALGFIDRHADLLNDPAEVKAVTLSVFDARADRSMRQKDWPAAVAVYQKALERFPQDSHLTQQLGYVLQRW